MRLPYYVHLFIYLFNYLFIYLFMLVTYSEIDLSEIFHIGNPSRATWSMEQVTYSMYSLRNIPIKGGGGGTLKIGCYR